MSMGWSLDGLNGKTVQKQDRKNQGGRGRRCQEGVAGKFGGKGGSKPEKEAWLIGSLPSNHSNHSGMGEVAGESMITLLRDVL
jgi:hypothetical protein